MSLGQCIVDILSNDVTDGDPNTVISNNSIYGWDLSTVPEFTYKSLGTLWIGTGTTQSQLAKRNSMGTC